MEKGYFHFLNTLDEDVYVTVLGDTLPFPLVWGPAKLTTKDRTGTPYKPAHQGWGYVVKFSKDKSPWIWDYLAMTKSLCVEENSLRCSLLKNDEGKNYIVSDVWDITKIAA